jgi:hypothetical protein
MNMKDDDVVSAVALVVEDSTPVVDEDSNQEELPADGSEPSISSADDLAQDGLDTSEGRGRYSLPLRSRR